MSAKATRWRPLPASHATHKPHGHRRHPHHRRGGRQRVRCSTRREDAPWMRGACLCMGQKKGGSRERSWASPLRAMRWHTVRVGCRPPTIPVLPPQASSYSGSLGSSRHSSRRDRNLGAQTARTASGKGLPGSPRGARGGLQGRYEVHRPANRERYRPFAAAVMRKLSAATMKANPDPNNPLELDRHPNLVLRSRRRLPRRAPCSGPL